LIHPRHSANRKERDIRRADAIASASHGVPEFMQKHAEKKGRNKGNLAHRSRPSRIPPSRESKKGRQEQESDMNSDIDA
jgi:hypothetical protein